MRVWELLVCWIFLSYEKSIIFNFHKPIPSIRATMVHAKPYFKFLFTMDDRASRIMSEYKNLNTARPTVMSTLNMIKSAVSKCDDVFLDSISSFEIMYVSSISSFRFQRATAMIIKLHAISKLDSMFAAFLSYQNIRSRNKSIIIFANFEQMIINIIAITISNNISIMLKMV